MVFFGVAIAGAIVAGGSQRRRQCEKSKPSGCRGEPLRAIARSARPCARHMIADASFARRGGMISTRHRSVREVDRSKLATEIKRKVKAARKISCALLSSAFISSAFGCSCEREFDFFCCGIRTFNTSTGDYHHGCQEKGEEESCEKEGQEEGQEEVTWTSVILTDGQIGTAHKNGYDIGANGKSADVSSQGF